MDLVGIVLGVVQGGVAAGVDPVDDGPHGGLDVGAGVAQQHEHRLLVVAAAGLAVHHDLVVVARLDQTSIVFILVPQIDISVKLYNHGEGLLLIESAN